VHFEYISKALDDLFQASSWKVKGSDPNLFLVETTGFRTVNVMVPTTCHQRTADASDDASIDSQEERKEE